MERSGLMIIIRQREVEEVSNLLSECGILPVKLVQSLLAKRGKNEDQIERIINQMVKRKLMWYDDTKYYVRLNKPITTAHLKQGHIKAIWLLIDLLDNIGDYYIQHDGPHVMTFFNINDESENPIYDVFYIPYNSENLSCFSINNMKLNGDTNKVLIIIDDVSQIPDIKLNDRFEIISFITVDANGDVNYNGGTDEDENE